MHHASVPLLDHVFFYLVAFHVIIFVPGGIIGVRFTLKFHNKAECAERDGLRCDDCNKLMVILYCGSSTSHSVKGDFGS